jgi:RimJ/RimL family protein N-acetyltransferase
MSEDGGVRPGIPVIVESERLRLRPLTVDDAAFVLELVSDPAFVEFIGDKGVRSLEDAERFLRDGPWTNQTKPGHGQLRVELTASGDPIGACGLLYRDRLDVTDVGFALLPAYRGRGYAFEAAAAVLRYGRETLGVERIVALTTRDNLSSIRVLTKLGMTFEREVCMSDDDPGTVHLYSRADTRPG